MLKWKNFGNMYNTSIPLFTIHTPKEENDSCLEEAPGKSYRIGVIAYLPHDEKEKGSYLIQLRSEEEIRTLKIRHTGCGFDPRKLAEKELMDWAEQFTRGSRKKIVWKTIGERERCTVNLGSFIPLDERTEEYPGLFNLKGKVKEVRLGRSVKYVAYIKVWAGRQWDEVRVPGLFDSLDHAYDTCNSIFSSCRKEMTGRLRFLAG